MANIIEGLIDPNQCIGDSLGDAPATPPFGSINSNFHNLDTKFRVSYTCGLSGLGTVGRNLSHGENVPTHTGIGMPYDGELIKAVLNVTNLDGELIVAPTVNSVVYNDYRIRRSGQGISVTTESEYNPLLPLTFEAGDVFGWQQRSVPADDITAFNVNYIVRFDM